MTTMNRALACGHVRTIQEHGERLALDPSYLDPSDLGEIEHALRQLRKISKT